MNACRVPIAAVAVVLFLGSAAAALADGPPPRELLTPALPSPADTLQRDGGESSPGAGQGWDDIERDGSYRRGRVRSGGHCTLRAVALASGVGFAALAIWRNDAANDRTVEYEQAIFSGSASTLRERVRDAERERNVFGALCGASFSIALLTLLY